MVERCENCEYYCDLEHNFQKGVGFEKSHCCLYFVLTERERYVVETAPNSMCEGFKRRIASGR